MKRRDVIQSLLAAPAFGALGGLSGCDHRSHGGVRAGFDGDLLGQNVAAGHRVRDNRFSYADYAAVTPVHCDVVVVGAGIAGLSATRKLRALGVQNVATLELESEAGGTSRAGHNTVSAYPWGAHYVPVPADVSSPITDLLLEMALVDRVGDQIVGREEHVVRAPESRVCFRGHFEPGVFPRQGALQTDLRELARFEAHVEALTRFRDSSGITAFRIPMQLSSADPMLRALDQVSAAAWLRREGYHSARLHWFLEYGTRDDFGTSLAQTSAWALLFYHAARSIVRPDGNEDAEFLTWPEGNGRIVRHLRNGVGDALQSSTLALRVEPTRDPSGQDYVSVYALTGDRPVVLRAQRVVLAVPQFIATRLLPRDNLPSAFSYGSWMVANLTLRSRPFARGTPDLAWDNVLYGSPSLGYVSATHQTGKDHGTTVWTYYYAFTDDDPRVARQRLLDATHAEWCEVIVTDLSRAHPDIAEHVQRIDVWRWGHAMVQPRPGFLFGGAREAAMEPYRGVHFANTDLSGMALFEEAYLHGVRVASEVAAALRAS